MATPTLPPAGEAPPARRLTDPAAAGLRFRLRPPHVAAPSPQVWEGELEDGLPHGMVSSAEQERSSGARGGPAEGKGSVPSVRRPKAPILLPVVTAIACAEGGGAPRRCGRAG